MTRIFKHANIIRMNRLFGLPDRVWDYLPIVMDMPWSQVRIQVIVL